VIIVQVLIVVLFTVRHYGNKSCCGLHFRTCNSQIFEYNKILLPFSALFFPFVVYIQLHRVDRHVRYHTLPRPTCHVSFLLRNHIVLFLFYLVALLEFCLLHKEYLLQLSQQLTIIHHSHPYYYRHILGKNMTHHLRNKFHDPKDFYQMHS